MPSGADPGADSAGAALPLGLREREEGGDLRGEVIAVVNLPELTNQEGGAEHDESKMVVLRSPENQTQFAIPADQMHPVVMLPGSLIDGAKGFITPIEHEGGLYKVIDTEMLYAEIAAHI